MAIVLALACAAAWSGIAAAARQSRTKAPVPPSSGIKIPGSLVKLLGQRIMVAMQGTEPDAQLLNGVRAGNIGAVILYDPNFVTIAQLTSVDQQLQQAAKAGGNPPLLIAIDQEGGGVKRLPGPPTLSPGQMAATHKPSVARAQGIATGRYLKKIGINLNIAPIVDVPTSPASFMYQENRTFSFSAKTVTRFGTAFALGQQSTGIASAAGLFPGLGAATQQTDADYGQKVYMTAAQRSAALEPYEMMIPAGLDAVMVANAIYPQYSPGDRLADLSAPVMLGLLRDQLGFNGVIITDAMIRTGLNPVTSGVLATEAGADIILYNTDAGGVIQALEAAYNSHQLTRADAVSSYERIVALKRRIVG